ncbi:MAG: c-type cytochrome [Myxococcota bacterium]
MPNHRLLTVLVIGVMSCTPPNRLVPKSSGSIAVSNDDALLFVADADHDTVTVIDTVKRAVVRQTKVGRQPERVLVAPSGDVYVTHRGSRSVSRLSPEGALVEATGTVGAEPVGLAMMPDGDRLLVANSMSGTISVLDARTLEPRAELEVGGRPWAVTPMPDGQRVYVTDFADGTVKVVDLDRGTRSTLTLEQPTTAECAWGSVPSRTPAQAADVVASPDGERMYVAHVQSRTGAAEGFNQTLRLAVAPAMSTIETGSLLVQRDQGLNSLEGTRPTQAFPPALLSTNLDEACTVVTGGTGMDAPSSLVVDALGEWIFVADHNSNAVAVVSSTRRFDGRFRVPERGIADVVRVGARPTGIAVAGDLRTMWVHNALDYTVSVVESVGGGRVEQRAVIPFATSGLSADVERGRRLFYSAVDPRVTQPEFGGVSCSSCHPDGRTDGLSWVLPQPGDWNTPWVPQTRAEARNTPALWGVRATAPYHWDGQLADLPAFSQRMISQMGGGGLASRDVTDLGAYMDTITLPDNPALGRLAPGLLARGQELFAANCETCHAGAQLTDGSRHLAANDTLLRLDTPSLRGVFATAPYLHDGSARTLREVLTGSAPTIREHNQRGLSAAELEALEAFVSTR